MKSWAKWSMVALVIAAISVASRVVISQQPAPLPPPPVNPYAAAFEQARPHLEAVLGVHFKTLPTFNEWTASELVRVPDPDLDAHLHWHFPQLQGDPLQGIRQAARQVIVGAALAQYVEKKDLIVVLPGSVDKLAVSDESLEQVKSPAFMQLALVYEVVRWHLDHCYNLARLRAGCGDADEFHALQAVIEGRAQDVTRQVAERLGTQALFPLLAGRYLHIKDEATDPLQRAASQTALQYRHRACIQGLAFFAALGDAGLTGAEAHVFQRLPRQTATIARPDRYLRALQANRPDLISVLQPLECALPAAQWQALQQTWTPAMLGQVAGLLGASKERVDKIAVTWDEGRSLVWTERKQPDHQVALSVVRHETAAAARAYFGFAVDLQRKQDTLPPGTCGPALHVVDSKSTVVTLEGFDEAVRNDKQIEFGGGQPVPASLLMARAGDLVVECTWHGSAADPALAERLVQAVRGAAR